MYSKYNWKTIADPRIFGSIFKISDISKDFCRGWLIEYQYQHQYQKDPKMRLDATDLRYVSPDEFRVLTAVGIPFGFAVMFTEELTIGKVEIGSKNHEVVPSNLIAEISGIRGGNVNKSLGSLAKRDLVARVQNAKCEGLSSSACL